MTKDQLATIKCEIRLNFHYVNYPENISAGLWRDGAGKIHFMDDMGLDHLKASIRKVERDIARLYRSDREQEVIDALIPLAEQKLSELKDEFKLKANA
ncbi:hypothetical protein [Thiobaca trueperi]|uniref:Uncharacterized protein n=1 Tax=Thiobaca trueperi TaxID=127458 RepID=A0A4R3MZF5_9GAMM|nr:hypothetical protein [Thiobaca trueperi]TCT19709.1 hypothetical protein EDC35_10737 [Thiobaca trueperi]